MLQRLKNWIEYGDEIEFRVHGKTYVVTPLEGSVVAIGAAYEDDLEFPDVDSMMNLYIIDGQPLKNVVEDIEIERVY